MKIDEHRVHGTCRTVPYQFAYSKTWVYQLVRFSGPFAYLAPKVYRKLSYQLVFIFHPFTYLLRPFVSAQGCISYRRITCNYTLHTTHSTHYTIHNTHYKLSFYQLHKLHILHTTHYTLQTKFLTSTHSTHFTHYTLHTTHFGLNS